MGFNPGTFIGGALAGPPGAIAGNAINGGGGKGGDAPSAPDFQAAATPTQTNAFGATSQWNKGADGRWQQNQSFGGPLGGAVQGMEGQLAGAWGSPLDNGAQARDAAQGAIYGREKSMLDPQWQQEQEQFNAQMNAQGLKPGTEAYDTAYGNLQRSKDFAYNQAQNSAIMGGGQEASRQQAMDLQSRMGPLQGLLGLSGLTGQSHNPLLPASIAQYQGDLTKYGIQQQGKNSTMNGLTSMGGNAAMLGMLA